MKHSRVGVLLFVVMTCERVNIDVGLVPFKWRWRKLRGTQRAEINKNRNIAVKVALEVAEGHSKGRNQSKQEYCR